MTTTKTATVVLIALLALGLTGCEATSDCGVPRGQGNPAQQHHAACQDAA